VLNAEALRAPERLRSIADFASRIATEAGAEITRIRSEGSFETSLKYGYELVSTAEGIGHTSCVLTQRPSMGVMLNP